MRKGNYTVDPDDSRRREGQMVDIRKAKREESLQKERRDGFPASAADAVPLMGHSTALQQKVRIPNEREQMRKGNYTVDPEDSRRRREGQMVDIRKAKREESLQKERRDGFPASAADAVPLMGHSTALQQKVDGLPAMVQAVLSNDPTVQLEATTQFRKLLSIAGDRETLWRYIDKMRSELKYEIDKVTAWQRLDLNLARG